MENTIEKSMEKDFKKQMIDLLNSLTEAGFEGAIPRLIAECVNEANFVYNTNAVTLYWTAVHCNYFYDKQNQ